MSDDGELLDLLASFGFERLTAQVYAILLTHDPLAMQDLVEIVSRSEAQLERSVSLLRRHRLAGVAYEHFRPRYYASDPSLAWHALSTELLWHGSGAIWQIVAQASEPAVEARRALCSQLSAVAGRLHRRHLAALAHREWDAMTTDELAQLVCEILSTARREIRAVSTSPRLPDVAAFWTVLTDRLAHGVRYRRVVDLDEIVAHGLRIVTRDIEERHIRLRVLDRDRIGHKYYAVDNRHVAIFHRADQPAGRGVGRISRKHHIVWRYHQRFPAYEQAAIPADFVVEQLRVSADAVRHRARLALTAPEVAWVESLVDLGKFSRFPEEAGWSDAELSRAQARATTLGLLRRNVEGELVVAYPLTEGQIRAAYEDARRAGRRDGGTHDLEE